MVIGVTGGVGAGKSTILKILQDQYQAKLIIADDVARELMEPGGASYQAVIDAFGSSILADLNEGEEKTARKIDRKKLAEVVFQDEEKLKLLNSLTHPKVKEEILHRIHCFYEEDPDALIVIEAALLIEAGYKDILDSLWIVTADMEVRIARLMQSRGYSREKCISIMENQLSDSEFLAEGDFAIDNSGTREESAEQIAAFFRI